MEAKDEGRNQIKAEILDEVADRPFDHYWAFAFEAGKKVGIRESKDINRKEAVEWLLSHKKDWFKLISGEIIPLSAEWTVKEWLAFSKGGDVEELEKWPNT